MADDGGTARFLPAFGADAAIAERHRTDAMAAAAIRNNLDAQLRAIAADGTRRDDTDRDADARASVPWIQPNLFAELCVHDMVADAEATVRNQLRLLSCVDVDDDDEYNDRQ